MRSRSTRKFGSLPSRPIASMRCARSRTAPAFSNDKAADVSGVTVDTAISIFFERTADRIVRIFLRLRRVIAGGLLCRDFHRRIGGHEIVGNWHALDDFDALAGQGIVLHVAHGNETV